MRNGLSFFLVLTTLMYGVSTIRTSKAIVNFLYYGARMKYSVKYAFLTEPYMYVSMNLENFANAVNKLDGHTYGYYTFDFILALTGLKHWLGEYLKIGEFPHLLSGSYNTYTMFFAYYRDFGIIGVCIIPFALGVIVSSQYYRLRRKPDIAGVCAYGVFVYVIIFSFFIPMLSWLHFVFNFAVILLASRLVVKRSQPPRFSPKT
jgi:oligosaccharide repeat unit polymerase